MLTYFSSKKFIPLIIAIAMAMETIDATVINTAIPSMAHSLQVTPVDLKIALISYLLALAIFIPISGWMADKLGAKRIFIFALGFFAVSSLWCGLASNLFELILARSLQGLGGSLMIPVGRLILARVFERHELVSAMNRVIVVASLGTMIGPALGGFITHYFSWRWIFWVNIPISIIAVLMARSWLPYLAPRKVPPLDKIGFVLFGLGLSSFTFSISALSESIFPRTHAIFIMCCSILLLLLYILHSRKQSHPIIKTSLFRARTFLVSTVGNLFARLGFGGVPFLLPLFLQVALGYPAQISGLLLAPIAFGVLLIKPFTLPLLRFFGYKKLLFFNTLLVSLSLFSFMLLNINTSAITICLMNFLFGFLIAIQYSGMNSLAYAGITADDLSATTSIMSVLQQLAQSFGVAISALLITYFAGKSTVKTFLTPNVFQNTFLAMGFITLCSAVIFLYLKKDDGNQLIKPPQ